MLKVMEEMSMKCEFVLGEGRQRLPISKMGCDFSVHFYVNMMQIGAVW